MVGFQGRLVEIAAVIAFGAVQEEARSPPTPEDLFARTYVRELALSHDGRRALVFERNGAKASASLVELAFADDGGVSRIEHPLPDDSWGHVAWDPETGIAAFLRAAPPRAELWLLEPEGEPRRAMAVSDAAEVFELFWRSRNGRSELLALMNSTEAGTREAMLVRVDLERASFAEELARFGRLTIREAALAPDGSRLALVATSTPSFAAEGEPFYLHVFDLEGGSEQRFTDGGIVARPVFSPDSKRLACMWQDASTLLSTEKRDVVVYDVESCAGHSVTSELPMSIGDGVYGAAESVGFVDDDTLLVSTQRGLADHVLAVDVDVHESGSFGTVRPSSSSCRFVTFGDLSWTRLRTSTSGRVLAVECGPSLPERVIAAQWPQLVPSVVESPNADLAARPLADARVLSFRGHEEWPMEGLLLTPKEWTSEGKPPSATVILLHGGSSGRATLRFNDNYVQGMAALGYAVFAPNLRGSAGYSVEFNRANERDFGGKELDDLEAAADELVKQGIADPARLYLLGHSYGGYLAQMVLTRSRRFAAACAASAVSDWETFVHSSDLAALAWIGFGGGPREQAELYAARSPMKLVDSIATPLLLVHGDRDRRVPISQSERLLAALRRQGVPCEINSLPRVGHVLRGDDAIRWLRSADRWFREHSPSPDPSTPKALGGTGR